MAAVYICVSTRLLATSVPALHTPLVVSIARRLSVCLSVCLLHWHNDHFPIKPICLDAEQGPAGAVLRRSQGSHGPQSEICPPLAIK